MKPGYPLLIVAGLMIFGMSLDHKWQMQEQAANQINCTKCHNYQQAMEDYFKRRGNRNPQKMAEAVLATKSPRLMAAIATKGEKNSPYTSRRGGYKKVHAGAWQVNRKLHGPVPFDPV